MIVYGKKMLASAKLQNFGTKNIFSETAYVWVLTFEI